MTDATVTLRLTANADGVVTGVRLASGEVANLGTAGQQAGNQAAMGFSRARAGVQSISQQLAAAKAQMLAFIGGAQALSVLRGMGRMSDEIANINGSLRLATRSNREFAVAQAEVFAISQRTSTALSSTAILYTRLAQSTKEYGLSQQRQLALVETINKTFAVSGAAAEEQKNAVVQFTQSLAGGILRAEEFNSVVEASPRLAQALADGMGIGMGELRRQVNEGQVSVERMVAALESQSAAVQREFEAMPLTIDRAWTQLVNAVTQGIGGLSQTLGAGGSLAEGIAFAAQHIGVLGNAIGVLAAAVAGRLVAAAGAYLVRQAAMIVGARAQAQAELAAARAAEGHAAARVQMGRAGMLASGQMAAAEASLAAAQLRTAAATQAASVALTAKAAAMRALNGVMAAFGGPVGLAVTALAVFVGWLVNSREEARRTAQEIREGFTSALEAVQAFNKAPSSQNVGGLADALELGNKLSAQLDELREKQRELAGERMRMQARGFDVAATDEALAATSRELAYMQLRYNELTGATEEAIDKTADMIQKASGLSSVSDEARRALEAQVRTIIEQKVSLETARPELVKFIESTAGAGAAARLAAADFRELQAAAKFDWSDIDKSLNQQLQAAQFRNIELTKGKAARMRAELAQQLTESGAYTPDNRTQVEARKAMLEAIIRQEAANDALAESQRKLATQTRGLGKANDEARQSQQRYTDQAALAAAELRGPLALAHEQSRQKIAELDAALGKHNITVTAHKTLVEAEAAALAKQTAELQKRMDAPQALLDAMTGELTLLRQIGPERELTRRRLQAEAEMRRELADAVEAAGSKEALAAKNGAASWAEYEATMLKAAGANAQLSMQIEAQAAQAEDWARLWVDAVGSVADAFTRFVMSGLRDFKGLWKELKNIAKQLVGDLIRTFLQQKIVIPIQAQIMQVFSGNALGIGQQGIGSVLSQGFDSLLSGITRIFSRGGAAAQAMQTATEAGWQMAKAAGVAVVPINGTGLILPNGSAIGSAGAASWAGVLGGLLMGVGMGGDTLGKIAGGLSGGLLGYGAYGAAGALASGGGLAGAFGIGAPGLGAFGAAGWIGLAAMAINAISGGKLFGTKYQTESGAQQFDINQSGATGFNSVTEVRQRSLFRGRKWRTTQTPFDAEAQAAIDELFETIRKTMQSAAAQLGVDVPAIVGGTFRREFDKNGNLTREFGTIAGRVYNESQEAFAARLIGENLLAVAKTAGSAVELEQLANAYRGTGEALQEFATLALAIQEDLTRSNGIWAKVDGDSVMTRIVGYIEGMAKAGESLADAYARIQQSIVQYGDLIGSVRQQIATHGLNQYQKAQLEVELAYREQVKQANDLAKALGLSGARAEDLAAIEQLRALNMADLAQQYAAQQQTQNQQWLQDLGLSDLSPLSDSQKLAQAMEQLNAAVAAGDTQRAQKLAEQALALGRGLYASGQDYNALYEQVTGLVGGLNNLTMEELQGLTNEELAGLADLVSGLPSQIAQELAALLIAPLPETAPAPTPGPTPAPAPAPVPPPPSGDGGGTGGGTSGGGGAHELPRHGNDTTQEQLMAIAAGIESVAASNQAMFALEQQRALDELSRGSRTGR